MPTGTKSIDRTWRSIVVKADPDYEASKRREPEYEMSNKTFTANRAERHPYNIEDE